MSVFSGDSIEVELIVLSAWEEASLFRHPGSVLMVCAVFEDYCCDAEDDEAHNGGIGLPVGRLCVPSSSR